MQRLIVPLDEAILGDDVPNIPEVDLLREILLQAIDDLRLPQYGKGKEIVDEAREWFTDTSTTSAFTFEGACAVLRLSASAIRRKVGIHTKT